MRKLNSLRFYRLRAGLTQYEAGAKAGISPVTISILERELRPPKSHHLKALAKAYEISVEQLLSENQLAC